MSRHSGLAKELFEKGYNCAQSVLAAFCDVTGLDFETALKLSSSFGGGMGRLREVCGAVSGILMAAGLLYGYTDAKDDEAKSDHYRLVQALALRFKAENDSLICRDLLGMTAEHDSPVPEKRTESYYQKRPCADYVACAAELLDKYIDETEGRSMIIAVASEGTQVTEHFGHCGNFILYHIENKRIARSESFANPGHRPGYLPNFLHDKGVNVIISGGMGSGAIEIFNEKNIEVVLGASGDAREAVESYLGGTLKSTGSVCHEHQHHDKCIE